MSNTVIELPAMQRAIVRDCLLEEFHTIAQAIADEDVQYQPISQTNLIDARWKVERLAVLIGLLEDVGFIPRRKGGYAGSLVDDFGTEARASGEELELVD